MDKKLALKILKGVVFDEGYHSGKWEAEYNREDSVNEYLNSMKSTCDYLNIEYSNNYEDYIWNPEEIDRDEIYLKDIMGNELNIKIIDFLEYEIFKNKE